jgi:hypothetical protein
LSEQTTASKRVSDRSSSVPGPVAPGGARVPGQPKIWIDLDNSPHVPFFAPIIDELEKRGYSVLLTGRDAFQVRELVELFHLDCKLVGRHFGKNTIRKMIGLCVRALQLTPTVLKERPDLAVSHVSRSQLLVSTSLGIPSLFICDYEFSTTSAGIYPTWYMCPELISADAVRCDASRVLKYPGIKEDVYVPRFVPDARIRTQLSLQEEDVVVTVRPPATEAHYHNPESTRLFEAVMELTSGQPDLKLVALPRNDKQAAWLRARWPELFASGKMRIPESVVDGLNLIWHSDLVVSGGGTMNREAAALGVPVYSIFRGAIGAVDRYLSKTGRLVLLESVGDVRTKMPLVRRDRPAAPQNRTVATLTSIVDQIVMIVDSKWHVGNRQIA